MMISVSVGKCGVMVDLFHNDEVHKNFLKLDIAYIRGHCGALRFVDIIP
jgi:hypothetical protein